MDSKMSILRGRLSNFIFSKVHNIFESVAFLEPNSKALIYEDNSQTRIHTFEEVDNLSNNLAKIITQTVIENGLHTEKDEHFIIGVHMLPSDYLIITLLAIWKAGASYLPLDPSYPHDRIEYIISDTKPALIIYNKENGNFSNTFKLFINDFILSDKDANIVKTTDIISIETKTDSAVVLYTSGSTGHPKGVCVSHTTILNRLRWQYKNFPFKETEKVGVFKTALTFVDSIFEIWGPLLKSRAVLVLPKQTVQNPEKLIQSLEKHQIHRIVLVPSLLESMLLYKEVSGKKTILPHLNLWISSGEILSKLLVNKFYKHFEVDKNKLCNFFGSTEVVDFTFHVITHSNQLDNYDSFPIGVAVDNTEVYILDSNKNLVPEGEVGEMYASGLCLPLKYISQRNDDKIITNDLNCGKTFSKLCKTGDVGQIKNNLLFFLGRTDSVIKIRGFRVDLIEIEKVVSAIEGVKKAVVLCYKPGDMNQSILAFVQTTDKTNEETIKDILKKTLPIHMVPEVVCIEIFPFLINGKVDRQLLLKNFDENHVDNVGVDYVGVPHEQLSAAKALFEIIASVTTGRLLSIISLESNFFDMGGNSLNAIYTITVLKDKGYHISIHDFIQSANLGEILDKMRKDSNQASIPSFEEYNDYATETMQNHHKDDIFEIFTTSFLNKSNIETLIDGITTENFHEYLENLWPYMLESGLSFIVKSKDGSIIAALFSHDLSIDTDYTLNSPVEIMDTFYVTLEKIVKPEIQKNYTKVYYAFMLGTVESLTPQENVLVVHFIEQEIIKLARSKEYQGIFTFNQCPLTEDIGRMYGYISYLDFQVNGYVTEDNKKPFEKAPDSQKVVAHFKKL